MKTRYKLLMESYNLKGIVAFLFNSLQSLLSDFLFGISYLFIFDYVKSNNIYRFYAIILVIIIFIYFIFFIPLWGYLMEKCEFIYREKLMSHLFNIKLKNEYSENSHSSAFLSLIQYDAEMSSKIAGWNLVVFFQAIISGSISSIIIGSLSLKMLFTVYLMGIIAIITDIVCAKYIGKITKNNREYLEIRLRYFIDFINNILIIKIYNQEVNFKDKIDKISKKIINNDIKINIFESITNLIDNMIYSIGFKVVVIIMGLKLVVQKEMTFGSLLLVFSMIGGITFIAEYLGGYIKTLRKIGVSSKKIDDFIENKSNKNKKVIVELKNIKKIELKKIKFEYFEPKKEIFNNLNILFEFPNNYIILGNNGSGKTTLLKLIFNLKQISSGNIYINEKILNKNNKYIFPFGFVSQQVSVYNGSIMENLRMDRESISDNEIKTAIRTSEIEKWINSLEKGIHTEISEKGKNISKGEKIRLAIARELIKRPEILFLDEPDANIDKKTMENILKNIEKNYPSLNLVVITHLSKRNMYKNFKQIFITSV